jgi:hypothetical protein
MRPVREGRKSLDYRKMNNPLAQPTRRVPPQTAPQEVSRPTAASAARRMARETAHLAHDTLIEKLEQRDPGDPEWFPRSVEEALESNECVEWEKAINEELTQLKEKGTWRLEDLPDGREAVGCRWVFVRKKDEQGNVVKYKA